jgi:hypothetical protein
MAMCQCGQIERQLSGTTGSMIGRSIPRLLTLKTKFENVLNDNPSDRELRKQWTDIVFHYAAKTLSREEDRLPALSGLARRFQCLDLGSYLAGLWSEHIHLLLLWRVSSIRYTYHNRSSAYVAPTWSWASVKGPVYFCTPDKNFDAHFISPEFNIVGEVLQCHCTPASLDPTGAVSDGALIVLADVINSAVFAQPDFDASPNELGYLFWIVDEKSRCCCQFTPDSVSDFDILAGRYGVLCMLWSLPSKGNSVPSNSGERLVSGSCVLVLRPSKMRPGAYERLGLLNVPESSQHYRECIGESEDNAGKTHPAPQRAVSPQRLMPFRDIREWFRESERRTIEII